MINLYSTQIEQMFLHKVGNKSRAEGVVLSEVPYNINDELTPLMKEFFFKPFREKEEKYLKFTHEADLGFHDLMGWIEDTFENPDLLGHTSKNIVKHLYGESAHPHIKSGEVYVCYLKNVILDNEPVDAIGIFKSEIKKDFLQFKHSGDHLEAVLKQGVSLEKIDKASMIFNTEKDEGFKILSVDNNKYDTKYWLENFLGVSEFHDENFYTKKYLGFCQDFAKDVVLPAEDKKDEIKFLNRAVNHFAKNDHFEETAFLNEVFENPDLIPEFRNYKVEKGMKFQVEDITEFDISNTAVSVARKKIKNIIKLDTGVEMKMNFTNPESFEKFVEKGWDEERQMYYYLVYFNKEEK